MLDSTGRGVRETEADIATRVPVDAGGVDSAQDSDDPLVRDPANGLFSGELEGDLQEFGLETYYAPGIAGGAEAELDFITHFQPALEVIEPAQGLYFVQLRLEWFHANDHTYYLSSSM
jgi:hypothetical protein